MFVILFSSAVMLISHHPAIPHRCGHELLEVFELLPFDRSDPGIPFDGVIVILTHIFRRVDCNIK